MIGIIIVAAAVFDASSLSTSTKTASPRYRARGGSVPNTVR